MTLVKECLSETEYDNKNSMICGECKQTMQNLFWIGFKNKMCLNSDCPKNNNDRDYCHCEHLHTLHEGTFGVCLVEGCECDAWYFMCNEEVWEAWQ